MSQRPKLYADTSGRRTAQILADVFMVCWVALCIWVGRAVTDAIGTLRGPADSLASAGDGFRDNMRTAAGNVGGVPVVGDTLRGPFDSLSGTGQQLANVGTSVGETVSSVASVVGIAVAVLPILLVLAVWLFFRIRFAVRATAAARLAAGPGADELFALRALTRQPLRALRPLGPDVASRFRAGDAATVRALATLEMRTCGLLPRRGEADPGNPRLSG